MKLKFLVLGFAAGLLMVIAGTTWNATTARADGVTMHNPATGVLAAPCAGCHRVHTAGGEKLLKQDGVVALCETCHAGAAGGSALKTDTGKSALEQNLSVALRGGGFSEALLDTDDTTSARAGNAKIPSLATGEGVTSKHDVDDESAAATIWGNGSGWGTSLSIFTCANCHDPHGGSNSGNPTFRILRVKPVGSGAASNVAVTDETAGTDRTYTTPDFYKPVGSGSKLVPEKVNPTFPGGGGYVVPASDSSADIAAAAATLVAGQAAGGINNWCAQCHTAYYQTTFDGNGPAGTDYEDLHQHKAVETAYAYYCLKNDGSAWSRAGELSTSPCPSGSTGPSQLQVRTASYSCVKCHVAHGTNATMTAGSYAAEVGDPGTDDNPSSKLLKANDRAICRKCHRDK